MNGVLIRSWSVGHGELFDFKDMPLEFELEIN